MRLIFQFILFLAVAAVPQEELSWKRLPDLLVPRAGHAVCELDGELTVFGGHTTGFVPTATAEYLSGGRWHSVPSLYTHDFGYAVPLRSGCVALGGGSAEAFGIGQSWSVERYDPATHSFTPMPILDRKRALSSAVELSDGTLVVSGNWYADDAIETGGPDVTSAHVKESAVQRSRPWILRSAPDEALVFSGLDTRGGPADGSLVDRLHGNPFEVPLLREWRPFNVLDMTYSSLSWIGDESAGDFSYLIPARDSTGQWAVLLVRGEDFSLLPTQEAIPGVGPWGPVDYSGILMADTSRRIAWMYGRDATKRAYLVRIAYGEALDGGSATVSLLHTSPIEDLPPASLSTLLSDGRIALAGGFIKDNYSPSGAVFILDPYGGGGFLTERQRGVLAGMLTATLLVLLGWIVARRRRALKQPAPEAPAASGVREKELFARFETLMEEEMLFCQKGLTLKDVAMQMGTNTKYLSACINSEAGCSFTDCINGYRVRHAQHLLRTSPGKRLADIADAAGFTSESAFYRNFKAVAGCTPAEWLAR